MNESGDLASLHESSDVPVGLWLWGDHALQVAAVYPLTWQETTQNIDVDKVNNNNENNNNDKDKIGYIVWYFLNIIDTVGVIMSDWCDAGTIENLNNPVTL